MIEKLCNKLTKKIQNKMPEIDNERAEIINYGLQLVIGEIPKIFMLIAIAYAFKILELSLLAVVFIMPYRIFSGGVHLKTHIGCIVATSLFYIGNAFLSKNIIIQPTYIKYIVIVFVWSFSMIMIKLYAPADTENVPILREKERNLKRKMSYITMTITLGIAIFINNFTISNVIIFGILLQTISITRFIYKLTNNRYGYEEYIKSKQIKNLA